MIILNQDNLWPHCVKGKRSENNKIPTLAINKQGMHVCDLGVQQDLLESQTVNRTSSNQICLKMRRDERCNMFTRETGQEIKVSGQAGDKPGRFMINIKNIFSATHTIYGNVQNFYTWIARVALFKL